MWAKKGRCWAIKGRRSSVLNSVAVEALMFNYLGFMLLVGVFKVSRFDSFGMKYGFFFRLVKFDKKGFNSYGFLFRFEFIQSINISTDVQGEVLR